GSVEWLISAALSWSGPTVCERPDLHDGACAWDAAGHDLGMDDRRVWRSAGGRHVLLEAGRVRRGGARSGSASGGWERARRFCPWRPPGRVAVTVCKYETCDQGERKTIARFRQESRVLARHV